jgi:hypothetical protein
VDGFPGSPHALKPFTSVFQNPATLPPKARSCRSDRHCVVRGREGGSSPGAGCLHSGSAWPPQQGLLRLRSQRPMPSTLESLAPGSAPQLAYELTASAFQARPFDLVAPSCAPKNATWLLGYGGSAPGPTILHPV